MQKYMTSWLNQTQEEEILFIMFRLFGILYKFSSKSIPNL